MEMLFLGFIIFISFYVLWNIALFIHELGHTLVGLLFGFEFVSLLVGRLKIEKKNKISVSYTKNSGAQSIMILPEKLLIDSKALNRASKMVLIAGPVSNVLFFIVCCIVCFNLRESSYLPVLLSPMIAILLFCIKSFHIGFDGGFSDILAYQLLTKDDTKKYMETCIKIQSFIIMILQNRILVENLDLNEINSLIQSKDDRFKYLGLSYLLFYYDNINNHDNVSLIKEELSMISKKLRIEQ